MDIHGHKVPDTLAFLWSWLPWVVAAIAGVVSFITNSIQIWESKTFRKWFGGWYNRRRAIRILRLRHELTEAENESEF